MPNFNMYDNYEQNDVKITKTYDLPVESIN